ncbi:acyl carrier protein [Lentzea tibetensis]|uniref:Acyl carrier protein n=1 Tax=Lentzea tibetensis TaxID=2591470 RepID=A0A563EIW7_9PSEU|nr:acyl carrier protein [Lentzea tibetensis]TWP46668.1 acyl carrier protein [Lentzea tibetensis]
MTAEQDTRTVEETLLGFLEVKTKAKVGLDQDLFASGLVTSMFAMQLVVHLESEYGVAIVGSDLKLDNFRTVTTMAALVRRLRDESAVTEGV